MDNDLHGNRMERSSQATEIHSCMDYGVVHDYFCCHMMMKSLSRPWSECDVTELNNPTFTSFIHTQKMYGIA